MTVPTFHLIPEGRKPRAVVLVWPERLPRRSHLVPLYLDLLAALPVEASVVLLVKSADIEDSVRSRVHERSPHPELLVHEVPSLHDIWIRDWAPVLVEDDRNQIAAVKAIYRPRYLPDTEAGASDRAGTTLARVLGLPVRHLPLVWDLGNLAHNGRGTAFITNRLIGDNEHLSLPRINDLLRTHLGITDPVFVPVEPGDVTGHTDGMVRFLDEKRILAAAYPGSHAHGKRFMNELAGIASRTTVAEVIRLPQPTPKEDSSEEIPSAIGCYVNYLRYGDTVLMPNYGTRHDRRANSVMKDAGFTVIPFRSKHLTSLARLGGVLNCISWNAY